MVKTSKDLTSSDKVEKVEKVKPSLPKKIHLTE